MASRIQNFFRHYAKVPSILGARSEEQSFARWSFKLSLALFFEFLSKLYSYSIYF